MATAVVKGKGENPTLHFLTDLKSGQQTEKEGVYYQNSDLCREDYAQNYPLDELPPTDLNKWVVNPLVKRNIRIGDENVELREVSLYETSGCPFECSFCASPVLNGRGMGYKAYYRSSIDRILMSIKLSIEMGANAVHFLDDMFFITPNHFREFASGVE